ncbi:MAG: hypothetical protein IPO88_17330 [Nannocystis sp.]|uniref:hypothetical protein n=1 Tax=Nannocystis sp. TaxID=1962667 RepID=UPI002428917D|nr:hypothetical protein [Nannocystis sp.]MBK9755227.1 hypothetical protein [Nannocystis sp.]
MLAGFVVSVVMLAGPRGARAAEIRTVARTLGEGYMVRVPGPEGQLLSRRRLVQYVNLGVYDLLAPRDRGELRRAHEDGQLRLVTSMRVRHDFGTYQTGADGRAAALVNQIDGRQIDVMFAYLEAENLRGMIDLRAGRQFEMSGLDWYAFDGAWFRVRTPVHLGLEVFGGFQVDGAALFGFPTFEQDGTAGTPADNKRSPMVGAAASVVGLRWFDARLAYRRTFSPLGVNQSVVNDDGSVGLPSAVDQEIVSLSAAARAADGRLSPYVALRYNLGTGRLDDTSAGLQLAFTPKHMLRFMYLRTRPVFDLDSIFNVFNLQAFEDARLVYQVQLGDRWTLAARGQFRFFRDTVTAQLGTAPERKLTVGAGGGATAGFRVRRFSARFDGYGLGGEGGLRVGGNLDTRTMVAWDRVAIDGRVFALRYRDEVTAARQGYSVALQAGVNVQLWRGIHLAVLGEEMFTSFYSQAFRVFGALTADWTLRTGR